MGMGINQLRKISLKLQVSTLLTYMLGFIVLKLSGSKKEGIPRHGKINTFGYALGALSLLYMLYSGIRLIIARKAPTILYIHGFFGLITLALSSLFVANRWSWKTVKNMRTLVVLFLSTFSGGVYMFSRFYKREVALRSQQIKNNGLKPVYN
jgi:Zn-dependent protease with chaperone function